jgi:opacity protein-like surface antigen
MKRRHAFLGSKISALVIAAFGPANAADLAVRYAKAPPSVPLYNWGGFYLGPNVGGAFGTESVSTPFGGFSTDPSGVLGGVELGYNFLLSPNWLLGIECTLEWTSAQGNAVIPNPVAAATITSTHDWYDTLDGRLGFIQGPWLYYAKGGAAWMAARDAVTGNFIGVTAGTTVASTRAGWTVGAGVEYLFPSGWSAKIEYDYLDFGTQNLLFTNVGSMVGFNTQVHEVKLGVNFHWQPGSLFGLF